MVYGAPPQGQFAPIQARPQMPIYRSQPRPPYGVPMFPVVQPQQWPQFINQRPINYQQMPQMQQPRPMMNQPAMSKPLPPLQTVPSPPIGKPLPPSSPSSIQNSPTSQEFRKSPSPIHVKNAKKASTILSHNYPPNNNNLPPPPSQHQMHILNNSPYPRPMMRPPPVPQHGAVQSSRSSMILIQPIPHPTIAGMMINPVTGNVMKVYF